MGFGSLLEALFEFYVDLMSQRVIEGDRLPLPAQPVPVALSHVVLGAVLGWVSLVVVPTALVPEAWRTLSLVGGPLATGLGFAALGWARPRFRFLCGVLLAVGVLVIRHAALG